MSGVFRATNLSKNFGNLQVLNALDFEVPEGSVFGLIGPNGAGKTTTIKIMMNILQPTTGQVEVLGIDSRRLGSDDMTKIGYVSENQEMPGWMTVRYLMDYLKPFYPTWDDARATELVREFDLPLDRELSRFSRGMWMKAALASSLAYRPRRRVYAKTGEGGVESYIRSVSYSPFPATLGFDPLEVHSFSGAPSATQAIITTKEPLSHFHIDAEIQGVSLTDYTAEANMTVPPPPPR